MPRHLQKRFRRWYAVLDIPAAARPQFAGKRRFVKSLETANLETAHRRLGAVLATWHAALAQASVRKDEGDAAYFGRLLRAAKTPSERDAILEQIGDAADAVGYLHAEPGQPPSKVPEAQEFHDRAMGLLTPTLDHVEPWLLASHLTERTKARNRFEVGRLAETFPLLRDITKPAVRKWAEELVMSDVSHRTLKRVLSSLRSYWGWLQDAGLVADGAGPFTGATPAKAPRTLPRREFSPSDVVRLREAAGDPALRDLITLGMWTGCRIEELCSLRVEHVGPASFRVVSAKTAAGVREVPIHPKLRQTMARLIEESTDGYVLPGQPVDRFGARSGAIGKRFGRLRSRLGYGPEHVFHSIRRCVVTMLENSGVSENLTADLVGHEKPRVTYGLYSGGASLAVKAAALALLDYPG